jgi:hypothetical protein
MTVLDRTHALGAGQGTHGRFFPELSRLQHGVAAPGRIGEGQLKPNGARSREPRPCGRPVTGGGIWDPGARVTVMSLFRRRERPDPGPSYAEEESNPELLAAEKAVNQMPSVPLVGGLTGVILGQRPQIVGLPDEVEPAEDDEHPEQP